MEREPGTAGGNGPALKFYRPPFEKGVALGAYGDPWIFPRGAVDGPGGTSVRDLTPKSSSPALTFERFIRPLVVENDLDLRVLFLKYLQKGRQEIKNSLLPPRQSARFPGFLRSAVPSADPEAPPIDPTPARPRPRGLLPPGATPLDARAVRTARRPVPVPTPSPPKSPLAGFDEPPRPPGRTSPPRHRQERPHLLNFHFFILTKAVYERTLNMRFFTPAHFFLNICNL